MIFTERTIMVVNDSATINKPLILYRGDKNIELKITIAESQFKFRSTGASNVIETANASYAQLVINTPYGSPIFSEVTATENGTVIFVISAAMIDEIREVGIYDIQIRLLDDNKQSRVTIPPVSNAIEIREPMAIEDGSAVDSNAVNVAKVNRALTTTSAPLEAFDSQGNYIKKTWGDGDPITDAALNKMEAGIDGVNKKVGNNRSQIKEIKNNYALKEDIGAPTQEQVDTWLNNNPQATTTVQDNSITYEKLNSSALSGIKDYVNGIEVTYEETSASGTTIELTDVGKTDIVSLNIEGNTSLSNSDPSTSNIRTISMLDNFTLTNNGKNLVTINTQLMKVGDTFDELNIKTCILTRRIKKLILTGEENWSVEQYATQNYRYFLTLDSADACSNDKEIYINGDSNIKYLRCTHYKSGGAHFYNYDDTCSFPYSGGTKFGICPAGYNAESNVDGFKTYLQEQYNAGTPVTVYYVLATPVEENISIDNISLLIGSNIITTSGELKANINLTYYKKEISNTGGTGDNTGTSNNAIFLLTKESTENISSIPNKSLILDARNDDKNVTPTAFHPTMHINDIITVGNVLRYYASIEPSYADQSCEWTTNEESKVTLTTIGNGFACDVKGVSPGSVTITCKPKNTNLTAVSTTITINEVN